VKVTLYIKVAEAEQSREMGELFEKSVQWDAIPREGQRVIVDHSLGDDGGWSEEVERVWWTNTDEVQVELSAVKDVYQEDLKGTLRKAGWEGRRAVET
jgi:hypothetical protein